MPSKNCASNAAHSKHSSKKLAVLTALLFLFGIGAGLGTTYATDSSDEYRNFKVGGAIAGAIILIMLLAAIANAAHKKGKSYFFPSSPLTPSTQPENNLSVSVELNNITLNR